MCSGKKVGEGTRKAIREKTATLVAAAHLPYRFVEQEALKGFLNLLWSWVHLMVVNRLLSL